MNAKEQIIQELKEKILNTIRFGNENYIQQLESLIDATEAAIFDVPTDDEIRKQASTFGLCFGAAMDMHNFILNYKPTL